MGGAARNAFIWESSDLLTKSITVLELLWYMKPAKREFRAWGRGSIKLRVIMLPGRRPATPSSRILAIKRSTGKRVYAQFWRRPQPHDGVLLHNYSLREFHTVVQPRGGVDLFPVRNVPRVLV